MTLAELSAWGAMIGGIGTLVGAVTLFIAAIIGRNTFENWRKQKSEERRIELADEIVLAAYDCQRDLAIARNGVMLLDERDDADAFLRANGSVTQNTSGSELQRKLYAQVILTKFYNQNSWSKLQALSARSKAIFGEAIECEFANIERARLNTIVGAKMYSTLTDPGPLASPAQIERCDAQQREIEKVIWALNPNDDPIKDGMQSSVARLEAALIPIIRAGSKPLKIPNM